MYTITAYSIYIALSILITVAVSRTLSKNGEVYLVDAFANELLAKSVNHMLVVGSYLLNLGFVLLRMQTSRGIDSVEHIIIYLSSSIGFVLFALGCAHFFNMFVIHRFREAQIRKLALAHKEPMPAEA
jgi:hypothetical protein